MAVYLVTNKSGEQHVVESANSQAALRYVAKKEYTVKTLTTGELVKFVKAGIAIEEESPETEAESVLEAKEE